MNNREEFEKWAKNYDFPLGKLKSGAYRTLRTAFAYAAFQRRQPEIDALLVALESVLLYAEDRTCSHDETHRGGAIWEICDSCGAKWADDEGGKPEWVEPSELANARAILAKYPEEK